MKSPRCDFSYENDLNIHFRLPRIILLCKAVTCFSASGQYPLDFTFHIDLRPYRTFADKSKSQLLPSISDTSPNTITLFLTIELKSDVPNWPPIIL